jgi:hypothetical protein
LSRLFFPAWTYHTWNKSLLTSHQKPPPHRRGMGKTGTRRRIEDVLEGRRKWDCGCLWSCICRYRTRCINLNFYNCSSDIPAVKMEPLANEQKCLFAREKSFSCSRNVLVGRVSICS